MRRLKLAVSLLLALACRRPAPPAAPVAASQPAPAVADKPPPSLPGRDSSAQDREPDVSATVPANDAVSVSRRQKLDVTFNEAMDPATLTASTFTLSQGSASVAGSVSYDAASDTATFTPTAPLGASLPYDARVDTGATNASGLRLVSPMSWSFTTRPAGGFEAPPAKPGDGK